MLTKNEWVCTSLSVRREERLRCATRAARAERNREFASAAHGWAEAYDFADGQEAEWCQARLALCLRMAQKVGSGGSPTPQGRVKDTVLSSLETMDM